MTEIETRVAGIPCRVLVTYYQPADPGWTFGPPERCWPSSDAEVEFRILDRRGRPAPWLERKLTDRERWRLEDEILSALNQPEEYEP